MIPSRRFGFRDVAQEMFEASYELKIKVTRAQGEFGSFLNFELSGGFDGDECDVTGLAKEMLKQFGELPKLEEPDD